MTLEAALLTAVTAVTGALCYVSKLLWDRSEKCEQHRDKMQDEIETLKSELGVKTGTMKAYEACPSQDCPFKSPARWHKKEPTGSVPEFPSEPQRT